MKSLKKVLSLVMALALVFSISITASAANVTIADDHTYTAYQVFSGQQDSKAADDNAPLGNVEWGKDINGSAFLTALQSATIAKAGSEENYDFSACASAADVAKIVATMGSDTEALRAFAKLAKSYVSGGTTLTNGTMTLADGYYVIVDTGVIDADDTANDIILQFTGSITVQAKHDVPQSEKSVKDSNDTDGTITDWQKSADWDVGDQIPYQLKATIQNQGYDNYTQYELTFVDTMSKGLELVAVTDVYWMEGVTKHTLTYTQSATAVTGVGEDDPYYGGTVYTWTLQDLVAAGVPAGTTIYFEYTAKLTDAAVIGNPGNPNKMHIEFSNNPNDTTSKGKDNDKQNIVFTYEITGDKVNDDEKALAGAVFTLYKKVSETTKGAQKMFEGTEDEGFYITIGTSTSTLNETTKKAEFGWTGLDDGTYVIEETGVPAGYNKMPNKTITISADHSVDGTTVTATGFTATTTGTGATGTVINQKGVQLPETGGIGTTLFYIIGGLMVAGAAILLVTKKRTGAAE